MGFGQSYLKIRVVNSYAGFIFWHNGSYKKVTICVDTDENTCYNKTCKATRREYKKYGMWYECDNINYIKFYNILTNFIPKTSNISALTAKLDVECGLRKYKTIQDTIKEWSSFILDKAGRIKDIIDVSCKIAIGMVAWKKTNMLPGILKNNLKIK